MVDSSFSSELVNTLSNQFNNTSFSCLSESVKRLLCNVGMVGSVDPEVLEREDASNHGQCFESHFKSLFSTLNCHTLTCDTEENEIIFVNLFLTINSFDTNFKEVHTSFSICSNGFIHFNNLIQEGNTGGCFGDFDKSVISSHYENCIQKMAPAFKLSESMLENLNADQFYKKYGPFLDWTKNSKLFCDCFELLIIKDGVNDFLALLLLCGGMEQALGNIYLTKGKKCPGLLKDLLATPELRIILGDSVVLVLHVILGPPISMNLRNIAWHGFFSANELPRSIGKHLSEQDFSLNLIVSRDYVLLSGSSDIAMCLTKLTEDQLVLIDTLIDSSWIITKGNKTIIKAGFHHYRNKNFSWCALCLLPQLEFTLRRLFVAANHCPGRLMTAEATTLYTTFEEMFDLRLPDGSDNALIAVCGEPFMDLLHDLLIYPKGPRARDKLSHGEADYSSVPESLCYVLVYCMAHLTLKSGPHEKLCPVHDYVSVFHPISLLKQKILELSALANVANSEFSKALDSNDCGNCDEVQSSLNNFVQSETMTFLNSEKLEWKTFPVKQVKPFEDVHQEVKFILSNRTIRTLYRWHPNRLSLAEACAKKVSESEVVNLASKILQEMDVCLRQTRFSLDQRQKLLLAKQLRSRQRDNLNSLFKFLPTLSLMTTYIVILSSWIFCHLDDYDTLGDTWGKILQRFLKNCLQTCENLRTFTSAEVCKWSLAGESILKEIKSGESFAGRTLFHASMKQ